MQLQGRWRGRQAETVGILTKSKLYYKPIIERILQNKNPKLQKFQTQKVKKPNSKSNCENQRVQTVGGKTRQAWGQGTLERDMGINADNLTEDKGTDQVYIHTG